MVHVLRSVGCFSFLEELNSSGFYYKISENEQEVHTQQSGADKSHCPTPGASAFSDRASEISLIACPWASDIS